MKTKSLKEKFTNNILVKPLYRRVRPKNVLVSVNINRTIYNLDGSGLNVKRVVSDPVKADKRSRKLTLPGTCVTSNCSKMMINKEYKFGNNELASVKMSSNMERSNPGENYSKETQDKFIEGKLFTPHVDKWLHVLPLPQFENESVVSIMFRCFASQLGLGCALILWTLIWVFVIHCFEGPYELKVSLDFEREENQHVIDLATELRQITPLSPRWREAIERRIQDERQLTITAVGKGAGAHQGQFWNVPGTFLFTVYVMTALGFGAPVPHTLWGRSAALIYAFIAVPTHFYLMINASTCVVGKCSARRCLSTRSINMLEKATGDCTKVSESEKCSQNSQNLKSVKEFGNTRGKLLRCLSTLSDCRYIPVLVILYFAFGVICFGIFRGRTAVESTMFPLEFTATGGLEHVRGHVRILYGFYVEGAVLLLACGLATLRRRRGTALDALAEKYRLFHVDV